jgi:hypothetical protein
VSRSLLSLGLLSILQCLVGTWDACVFAEKPRPEKSIKPSCPELPNAQAIFARQKSLKERCALLSSGEIDQSSRVRLPLHVDWVVHSLALELSAAGGVGWRVYKPLTSGPAQIPQVDPPLEACAYRFSLFERRGEVWALERWSLSSPTVSTSIRHSLSHRYYTTLSVRLSASNTLSDPQHWELTPQGICPALLPQPLDATAQLTSLIGCGSGATMLGQSALQWRRLP